MKIPLSSPDIIKKDRDSVLKVLNTSQLSLGPKLKEFEVKIASYIGVKYAVGVCNGTAALHMIVRALGIKRGEEVITTPFSFVSSSNCFLYEGAKPVFVDICPDTLNIDTSKIEKRIGKKTKAILAVDVFGNPADWGRLRLIARKHNLRLIEDSAEAIGSEYCGKKCGSLADAAILSFYPNKQMTTGEGGAVLTNNKSLASLCRSLSNQGRKAKGGSWLEHLRLGYNYRLSDINAALGISQLSRISEMIEKRKKVAGMYNFYFKGTEGISMPFANPDAKVSWFVYVIRLKDKYTRADRDRIISILFKKGIQSSTYFRPIHLQHFYRSLFGYKKGDFPVCEHVSDRTIALPFYNNLSEKEVRYITDTLKGIL